MNEGGGQRGEEEEDISPVHLVWRHWRRGRREGGKKGRREIM